MAINNVVRSVRAAGGIGCVVVFIPRRIQANRLDQGLRIPARPPGRPR
jgi:hypothetical protein